MPVRDVAIYLPTASAAYERGAGRSGGAERQTCLLARTLSEHGLDVVHVVSPVDDLEVPADAGYGVLERRPVDQGRAGKAFEPWRVWQALDEADARCYVLRMGTASVGVAGAFCRAKKRRFIWAAANDGDLTLETVEGWPGSRRMFVSGLRRADAVVTQSGGQTELARQRFPSLRRVVEIPSFVERHRPADGPGEAFLWAGRLVAYKEPERYLDLAEALPEARFRMVAVADEETASTAHRLRERAATLPNVELLGPQPHAEVLDLIKEAAAVVSTSRLEGMPNVFLEAWSVGVPALSLHVDPDARIAKNGLGVAADGDWSTFVDGAKRLWDDRADRRAYGEATTAFVEREHSGAAEAWTSLVSSVLARGR